MGIEAENTMAQQAAEERKPTDHEWGLAKQLLSTGPMPTTLTLASLLAEHRMETKRVVLEEQGVADGQDLEKRHALSVRVTHLEAQVKELEAAKVRLATALGNFVADKIEMLGWNPVGNEMALQHLHAENVELKKKLESINAALAGRQLAAPTGLGDHGNGGCTGASPYDAGSGGLRSLK